MPCAAHVFIRSHAGLQKGDAQLQHTCNTPPEGRVICPDEPKTTQFTTRPPMGSKDCAAKPMWSASFGNAGKYWTHRQMRQQKSFISESNARGFEPRYLQLLEECWHALVLTVWHQKLQHRGIDRALHSPGCSPNIRQ